MIIKNIDNKIEWNNLVKEFPSYSFFNSYERLEAEEEYKNSKILKEAFYENNLLVGLCAYKIINAKRGKILYLQHFPLLKEIKYFKEIFKRIRGIAKENKVSFIRATPLIDINYQKEFLELGFTRANTHNLDKVITIILDLSNDESTLLQNMRKSTRYEIRKDSDVVKIKFETSKEAVLTFLENYFEFVKNSGYKEHSKKLYEEELLNYLNSGILAVLSAYKNNELLSSAIIVSFGNYSAYYLAYNSPNLSSGANHKVLWEAIKKAKRENKIYFDLWGGLVSSKSKNQTWKGIDFFKSGFGGERIESVPVIDYPINKIFYFISSIYERFELIFKSLRS